MASSLFHPITNHLVFLFCCPLGFLGGEGNGTPLQYSCLENPMDGGASWATVHGVAKSWTRLSNFTFTCHWFLGSSAGKESTCTAGDPVSILGLERSPAEGTGYPLQ